MWIILCDVERKLLWKKGVGFFFSIFIQLFCFCFIFTSLLLVTYLAQTSGGSGCWLDIKKLVEVGILIFVLALFCCFLEFYFFFAVIYSLLLEYKLVTYHFFRTIFPQTFLPGQFNSPTRSHKRFETFSMQFAACVAV